jgi:hypothetical protein
MAAREGGRLIELEAATADEGAERHDIKPARERTRRSRNGDDIATLHAADVHP